ncbi:MAG: hypothetical protein ACRCST_03105 [Turicibacter sp.]
MKYKRRIQLFILLSGVFMTCILNAGKYDVQAKKQENKTSLFKEIQVTKKLPTIPENYQYIDMYGMAKQYNTMLFDFETYGLGYTERSYYNTSGESFGLLTYAGEEVDLTKSQAMNAIAALISAYLINPDSVSTEQLEKYVQMVQTYYNIENGEGIILNYPTTRSNELSFWEQIYPSILYFMLMDRYEPTPDSDAILKNTADRWHDVVMNLGGKEGKVDFSYTGYDFKNEEPFDNGEWIEPSAAGGVALLEYFAYAKFKDPKYMKATKLCMDYMEEFRRNPGYEVLYLYLPFLSARLNALERGKYDTAKYMDWVFNLTDIRQNHGMILSEFGTGLIGDPTLYGGTAQSFPSLVAPSALVPMLKYDQRYAKEIGRYLLHFTNSINLFYAQNLEQANQTNYEESKEYHHLIPYESVNKKGEPMGPYGTGTADGSTNLSILSGSFLGLIGAMIEESNVPGILKVNLNTNDYYVDEETDYPMYLIYNPYEEEHVVKYEIESDGEVSLYDTVSQKFVAERVTGVQEVTLKANNAVILMEIPSEKEAYQQEIKREVTKNVKSKVFVSVNIVGLSEYEPIQDDTPIELDIKKSDDTRVTNIEIFVDGKSVFKNPSYAKPYTLDVDKLANGYHILSAQVKDNSGTIDKSYARIFIQKDENPYVLNELPKDLINWESYQGGSVDYKNGQSQVVISGNDKMKSGIISKPFKINFSQRPLLTMEILDYNEPYSIFIQTMDTFEKFYLVQDEERAGKFYLDFNVELYKLNPQKFQLKGEHEVQLGFEVLGDNGFVEMNKLRILNEGIQPLKHKEWKTGFTTKDMLNWQIRSSQLGKINYYNGLAEIRNLNPVGSGGIKSDYFEADLKRNPKLTLKVLEADDLWSVLMYIENDKQGYYLQYPTSETGKFSYDVNDVLKEANLSPDELGKKNIQFWFVTDGDYGAVTKIDYLRLEYEKNWLELAFIGTMGMVCLVGIFVNMNKKS